MIKYKVEIIRLKAEIETYKKHIKQLHLVECWEGDTMSALRTAITRCPKHYYSNNPDFTLGDDGLEIGYSSPTNYLCSETFDNVSWTKNAE